MVFRYHGIVPSELLKLTNKVLSGEIAINLGEMLLFRQI